MSAVLVGEHPSRGKLYAVIDERAHHVAGRVAERRMPAFLSPFRSHEDAKAALLAEGATVAA